MQGDSNNVSSTVMQKGISGEELVVHGLYGVFTQALGAVPVVGGAILGAIESVKLHREAQFMESLTQELERLGKEKLDKSYVESEEFFDLLYQALTAMAKHRSQRKAKVLVSLLAESMTIDRNRTIEADFKERFISILDTLTESELCFLYDFAKGVYAGKTKSEIYESGNYIAGICLDSLVARGILSISEAWNQHVEETNLGKEFISYIRLLPTPDCA